MTCTVTKNIIMQIQLEGEKYKGVSGTFAIPKYSSEYFKAYCTT